MPGHDRSWRLEVGTQCVRWKQGRVRLGVLPRTALKASMRAAPAPCPHRTSSRSVTRLDAVDAVHRHDVGAREVREGRSSHPVALAIAWTRHSTRRRRSRGATLVNPRPADRRGSSHLPPDRATSRVRDRRALARALPLDRYARRCLTPACSLTLFSTSTGSCGVSGSPGSTGYAALPTMGDRTLEPRTSCL